MSADMKSYVSELLEGYRARERKIAVLRYDLEHPSEVGVTEQIEAMNYGSGEGVGHSKGHVSNKTLYIALNYEEQAKQLNAFFDARLNVLLAENADASKEKQYHLKRQILPGIAAYETLQRVMPKEEALQTVHGYVERLARTSHKQLAALLHIPGLYRLVPGVFVKSTRSVFGPAAGFAPKELQTGNGVWRVDMMKCPYHDTCAEYGCPELCRCFCDSDDISYTGLHPKLIWERSMTLGRGNDRCDFCMKVEK